MARCLVTGHKGYIGAHLFKKLQELGHEVQGIDLQEEYSKDINSLQGLAEDEVGNFHPHFWNFNSISLRHFSFFIFFYLVTVKLNDPPHFWNFTKNVKCERYRRRN